MNQLDPFMDKAEHLVRKHSRTPRAEHPALENARQAVEQEAAWYDSTERLHSLKLLRAIRLAPTLDVCEAILRGEPVPRSRLDIDWAKAYRL